MMFTAEFRMRRLFILIGMLLVLAGCASQPPGQPPGQPSEPVASCKVEYYEHINDPKNIDKQRDYEECCASKGYFDHLHCYGGP